MHHVHQQPASTVYTYIENTIRAWHIDISTVYTSTIQSATTSTVYIHQQYNTISIDMCTLRTRAPAEHRWSSKNVSMQSLCLFVFFVARSTAVFYER